MIGKPFSSKIEYISKITNVVSWIFSFYLENFRTKTITLLICDIVLNLRSIFYAYFISRIIDNLIQIVSTGGELPNLYPYLVIFFLYTVIIEVVVRNLRSYTYRSLSRQSRISLDRIYYVHLSSIGIQQMEDPDVQNIANRSREWIYETFQVLEQSILVVSSIIKFAVSMIVVYSIFPWLIPAFVIFAAIRYIPDRHYDKKDFSWQTNDDNSEGMRMARNSMQVLQDPKSMDEVMINNSFNFFDRKYIDFYTNYTKVLIKIFRERAIVNAILESFDSLLNVVAYAFVFIRAINGDITIGTVTFYIRSVDSFSDSISGILNSLAWVNDFSLKMGDLMKFFDIKPIENPKDSQKIGKLENPPSIEFRNVCFRYPRSERIVFKDLNFKINSGEKVALVGHNGAGKTTLIKLICRFYEIESGEILFNGINIKEIDLNDLYLNLGVLFQDYNFYDHLTLKENIIVGDVNKNVDENELKEIIRQSDIDSFIGEYKNGMNQILTERYRGGIRPSTGQQQKIAIARFFYRNAPLAIFDEPTSAIDAVSEYKIFNEIYKYFVNKTVIIISHRFSTVRNADRIIVLDHGKIVEEGTHEELLARERIYSHAYKLQAEGYRD